LRPYAPRQADIDAVLAMPKHGTADVAIVLGCPALPDGSASLCEMCRVFSAVEQWQAGNARNFIFTGGAAHSPHVEADVMADQAVARGIPAEHVLREGRALTTWQNLRFSTRLAHERGWKTVLIISTADHLPRARRIAQFWGLDDDHTAYTACDRQTR
jgi:uncharacterized SAM-binding protein YcdF (DUF218 family)